MRRPLLRALASVAAFTALPLLAGVAATAMALSGPPPAPTPPAAAPPVPVPVHDPGKQTAVVVAGTTGAESIDVLVPYQLLAETDAFNVYTVAPERRVLPLFPGSPRLQGVDFLPHLTFDDYDEQIAVAPDVVVVPWVPDAVTPENAPLRRWLDTRVTGETTLLTICGGSWTAAQAGLLDGRAATTHHNVLPLVRERFPATEWVDGRRWVEDGHVISSAGITAAYDATLRAIERHLGRPAAEQVADRVGYPHLRFLDDPAHTVPAVSTAVRTLQLAYGWNRARVGVLLTDGIAEVDVAAVVDLYPRTHTNEVIGVSVDGDVVTTRHGLHLVARGRLTEATNLDRLIVPGAANDRELARRQHDWTVPVADLRSGGEAFLIDAVVHDIATHDNSASAALVARGIEYPMATEGLSGAAFPHALLLRPLLLGVLGLGLLAAARRSRAQRRSRP
jgi:putative intracellular protease/amidase